MLFGQLSLTYGLCFNGQGRNASPRPCYSQQSAASNEKMYLELLDTCCCKSVCKREPLHGRQCADSSDCNELQAMEDNVYQHARMPGQYLGNGLQPSSGGTACVMSSTSDLYHLHQSL